MKGILQKGGCDITENEELADVLVLNSCIVKTPTENKIVHKLKRWQEDYPDKKIIVSGCMPQADYSKTVDVVPEASLVGPNNCRDITKAVRKTMEGERVEYLDEKKEDRFCLPRIRENDLIGIVEIAQGCCGNCSYCQVKFAKGELKSYESDSIVDEVKRSLRSGCKEIWLTTQDTASYGTDIGTSLPELLEKIVKVPGKFRVRIGMMNVDTLQPILEELAEVYGSDKIYSFLHLPLQSGSNRILEEMNRRYTVEEFKKVVERFRDSVPELNLWTDIIVGFPSENENDFKRTVETVEEIKPDRVNVSRFGLRPGTRAESLDDKRSEETKKIRSRKLSDLTREIRTDRLKNFVGEDREVLILGKNKRVWKGKDGTYRNVLVENGKNVKGSFRKVEIKSCGVSGLVGSISY